MYTSVNAYGRLVADPELKRVGDNTSLVNFTIAVPRRIADKSGEKKTDFVKCKAWNKTAEVISKYFAKGSSILIRDAEIHVDNYTGKNGEPKTAWSLNVQNIDFVGSNKNSPAARGEEVTYAAPASQAAQNPTPIDNLGEFEEVVGDGDLLF